MWGIEPSDVPLILMAVCWLIFLEGLLSADNALVLAMMVRHLPRPEQKRALRYGIWGAFAFRVLAVLLARVLLDFWILKVIGGLYLLYLAVSHFLQSGGEEHSDSPRRRVGSGFWGTVISVEIADIAFSVDSILAAVALADGLPSDRVGPTEKYAIVVTGGILGILTMRFVAGYFILLLERFRGLEPGAYGLVAWIGLKLTAGGLHRAHILPFELNEWVFWIGMAFIVLAGFVYKPKSPPTPADTLELAQDMARAASGGSMDDEPEPTPESGLEDQDDPTGPDPRGGNGEGVGNHSKAAAGLSIPPVEPFDA